MLLQLLLRLVVVVVVLGVVAIGRFPRDVRLVQPEGLFEFELDRQLHDIEREEASVNRAAKLEPFPFYVVHHFRLFYLGATTVARKSKTNRAV